jgi:uncharacterized protein YigE (DUF2233 family)
MIAPRPVLIVAMGLVVAAVHAAASPRARDLVRDDAHYRVVALDLARDALELHWKDPTGRAYGSIARLREEGSARGRRLVFAANAGIYGGDERPLGLHVEEGRAVRPLNLAPTGRGRGNFALAPNGVFYVDRAGRAGVMTTARWRDGHVDPRLATQSGPMLVIDGEVNPVFDPASDSRKWRSGVCAPTPGRVVFAVSAAPVTFHAFARVFRDDLGCLDALYLDGTLSRLWTSEDGYAGAPAFMVKPYVGVFAVFAPADAPAEPASPGGASSSPER